MADEVKMLKSTRNFINNLLNAEVKSRKDRMIDCINNELPAVADRIKNYQEAFKAQQDYFEWDCEQGD